MQYFNYPGWSKNHKIYMIGRLLEIFFNNHPDNILEPGYLRNSIEIEFFEILSIVRFYEQSAVLKGSELGSTDVVACNNWWQELNIILTNYKPIEEKSVFGKLYGGIKKYSLRIIIDASIIILATVVINYIYIKPDKSYKQVGVDFENWMEQYDSNLISGFELFETDVAARKMYYAGETPTYAIKYFQEFRRKRDNKIDSFLIAYSLAGGDTLNLNFSKKLGVNVNTIIESKWGGIIKDLDKYRLDTL
jgi:hypothetical protein